MRLFTPLVMVAVISSTKGLFFWTDLDQKVGEHILGELILVMKLLDSTTPYTYAEACGEYVAAQERLDDTVPADGTNTGNFYVWKKATSDELDDIVEGVCLRDGSLDPCANLMLDCGDELMTASQSIEQKHSDRACTDMKLFNDCIETAIQVCPESRLVSVKENEADLAVRASGVGCELDCNDTMAACTYALGVSSDEEFSKSYEAAEDCLRKVTTEAGCEAEKSQEYLDSAIERRKNSHNGSGPVNHRSVVLLTTLNVVATLVSRRLD